MSSRYRRNVLAKLFSLLSSEGIEGVIIGSTTYMLHLGFKELEDDVDIFTTSISPTIDEEVIRRLASKYGYFLGQTEWGTPQLHVRIDEYELIVEFYENMYDFFIPQEVINDAITYSIAGQEVKAIRVEDYIILKAKAGRDKDIEDLNYLSDLIRCHDLRINTKVMRERLKLFEDYEAKLIIKRLSSVGIKL